MNPRIPWWRTSFGEEEVQAIAEAIRAEHITMGPITAELEKKLAEALGVPYAVVTTSGSVALLMALIALGIEPGDEVILPNRTFVATAHAVVLLGAKVVLVDVRQDIPVLDVTQLRAKITPRTKAIMPVHLCGRGGDLEELLRIAKEHGLLVVEDACQAIFSRGEQGYLGTRSDAGCYSLGITKLIGTGQGGLVVTRDVETYQKLRLVRNHGVADVFKADFNLLGFNFKFTDMMAALGLVQLGRAPTTSATSSPCTPATPRGLRRCRTCGWFR